MSSVVRVRAPIGANSEWVPAALTQAEGVQRRFGSQLLGVISEARAVWQKLLFPTPSLEGWKYTNPEAIAQGGFSFNPTPTADSSAQALAAQARIKGLAPVCELVFVNGVFDGALSTLGSAQGLTVSRLTDGATSEQSERIGSLGVHRDDSFAALATALLSECVSISVARGSAVTSPIHVIYLTTESANECVITPRIVIEAAEAAQVTIVESHIGAHGARYLSLPVVEIQADSGAVVDYYRIQRESERAYHVSALAVQQHRSSTVRTHIVSFGGALVRNNAHVSLSGVGAQAVLNGLSLLSQAQHVDNSTTIHHREPSAESREHFKGIYADASKGVFSGTITVDKIAQKTNAFQSNQALLLSSDASIESRPQLMIWLMM